MIYKIHPLFFLFAFIFASCSQNAILDEPYNEFESVTEDSKVLNAISNYININHPIQSRRGEVSIEPYIIYGDTVMYIVNYGEENGWELFSNATSTPMLLLKSSAGKFEDLFNDIFLPVNEIIHNAAQKIWEIKKSDSTMSRIVNEEWRVYSRVLNITGGQSALTVISRASDDYSGYQFILSSDTETSTEILKPKGGRLKTKWTQNGNYNQYTPFYEDNYYQHTYVGCVAVAFGQFFYHSHYQFGLPKYTVTDAAYNSSKNTYSFSGSSSTIWDSFNSYPDRCGQPDYMRPTAIFLGYIGVSLKMKYGKIYYGNDGKSDGSSSNTISKNSMEFFNSQTQLDIEIKNLNSEDVKSVLRKGHPVVSWIYHYPGDKSGHTFLIDYFESERTKFYNYYTTTIYPEDAEWPDIPADISIDELKNLFGEIIVEEVVSTKTFYQMNWGQSGYCDNYKIDPWCMEWNVLDTVYDRSTAKMYNIL
ncbi:MAG: C10 family peptidase [Muribaculum sp.]|nr:C10 family peptidase [Muribaculum sp.]